MGWPDGLVVPDGRTYVDLIVERVGGQYVVVKVWVLVVVVPSVTHVVVTVPVEVIVVVPFKDV